MQFQGPIAGEMLDGIAAGTIVDRLALQPLERGRAKFDVMMAVFGPLGIMLEVERHPERGEFLLPLLAESIDRASPLYMAAYRKVTTREKQKQEAAEELFADDPTYVPGTSPGEHMVMKCFRDWTPPPPTPQDGAEYIPPGTDVEMRTA
jgi:hypothetical protein